MRLQYIWYFNFLVPYYMNSVMWFIVHVWWKNVFCCSLSVQLYLLICIAQQISDLCTVVNNTMCRMLILLNACIILKNGDTLWSWEFVEMIVLIADYLQVIKKKISPSHNWLMILMNYNDVNVFCSWNLHNTVTT